MDMLINFLVAAIGAGTPLLFGTLGEIITEKTGHLNLGVEGIMLVGADTAFVEMFFQCITVFAAHGEDVFQQQHGAHCIPRPCAEKAQGCQWRLG